ncbi:MAG: hydroxyacid dehydrogenase [Bdellovibrio sp. CG10_big_fil_rev_8_21_14_0_10_47_8]|nr:MAG: hydroxyacid dehydrogenase [Bdellovibrio sp. CG10_big_fil_rev_8_21_14_0_10_47_8]
MRIAVFDTHAFERDVLINANRQFSHELVFFDSRLTSETAELAKGFSAACSFVNDRLNSACLEKLHHQNVKLLALRSAGFNHVDLATASRLGLKVVRVPHYSPHAVAEHAVALILSLNRKIHRAYQRVREMNFSLDGLVGFDLNGKTIGVIGTGQIGSVFVRIMAGFGCKVIAYDIAPNPELSQVSNFRYVDLETLYRQADVVSLHLPLRPETQHMIDEKSLAMMKAGVMLINTSRGALIDSKALIQSLKSGHIGSAGLDVYEEEEKIFFRDLSAQVMQDDILARLLTFPNVIVTAHQAFLTNEALQNIAQTTLQNAADFEAGRPLENEVCEKIHTRN